MNVSLRSKLLIGIAAGIAAWVAFGPRESESTEAVPANTHGGSHVRHVGVNVTTGAGATARTPASTAERVADDVSAGALFAAHSWYVAPPPPPPPVVNTAPEPPPKPTAPPLPYTLIGSYTPDGEPTVFFLSAGDRVYDVHVGDTLDHTYSIDSYNNGQLVLTYKPLNERQQLQLAGAGK